MTDGAGNASQGTATLNVGAPNAVSISSQVTYNGSAFAITGMASSAAGVRGVEISAVVNGVATDLGAATVNANGTFVFSDLIGASTQGFITATETDAAGGTASAQANYSLQGGLDTPNSGRAPFVAEQDVYTADGSATTSVSLFRGDGSTTNDASRRTTIMAAGQTFTSDQFDDFKNGGTPETTFVFNPNHGLDTISLFRPDNVDHDTLSFKGSDFGNSIANVLRDTHQTAGGSSIITDPTTGDTVKLVGITKAELRANQGDFAFHA